MIKIEKMHFEEFLGIRDLKINCNHQSIAIVGPNGSGKSGVIEGAVFGLIGRIKRFEGTGSKGLSIDKYGANINKKESPQDSLVKLTVKLTNIGKTAEITRKVSSPENLNITPNNPKIKEELDKVSKLTEIALTRKNMLQFILVEPSKRGQQVQALLDLENFETIRKNMNTVKNNLIKDSKNAKSDCTTRLDELLRHFDIEKYDEFTFLKIINEKCNILGLPEITEISENLIENLKLGERQQNSEFNKESTIRDIENSIEYIKSIPKLHSDQKSNLLQVIAELENNPALFQLYTNHDWLTKGIENVIDMHCPLCDTRFDSQEFLIEHLRKKLKMSQKAEKLYETANVNGNILYTEIEKLSKLLNQLAQISKITEDKELITIIEKWTGDLVEFQTQLTNFSEIVNLKERLYDNWLKIPTNFTQFMEKLKQKIHAIPDQSKKVEAVSFLIEAKLRFESYFNSKKKSEHANHIEQHAINIYKLFCEVVDGKLDSLYETVNEDFCKFYRFVNIGDEDEFNAKFISNAGSLDLKVDFYDRGLFPPGAYHSEGHQDMMGLCLYLALIKQVHSNNPSLILLDDVLMSIDANHRRRVSKMLNKFFGKTQFVITTHDRVWVTKMQNENLIDGKNTFRFYGWNVQKGASIKVSGDIWTQIDEKINESDIEPAAQMLRRYLEGLFLNLVEDLRAPIIYHANDQYVFGELFDSAHPKLKKHYKKALDSANSWRKADQIKIIETRIKNLEENVDNCKSEQWVINKVVHYNDWANFTQCELEEVVTAFKELLKCFKCESCNSWLYLSQNSLRCDCNEVNLNLKVK